MNPAGETIRTFKRVPEVAERLAKFKKTFKIDAAILPPKKREVVPEKPNTFLDSHDEKDEIKMVDAIEKINAITKKADIGKLEEYLNHPMKTVKNLAERKFKELTAAKK